MKWTQRQKIGGAVLVLAAGALVIDRCTSAPADESVSADTVAITPTNRTMKSAAETAQSAATTTAIAQRLERVASAELIQPGLSSDAFSPPPGWFGTRGTVTRPTGDWGSELKAKYRLSAVMKEGTAGGGVAILAGPAGSVAVRAGQSIDGFVLTSVRENAIILNDGHGPVEIRLDRSGLGATATIAP